TRKRQRRQALYGAATLESLQLALHTRDQRHLLELREKCALARIEYDAREVRLGQAQHALGHEILVGERDAVHHPAVGVQRDDHALVEITLERMLGE